MSHRLRTIWNCPDLPSNFAIVTARTYRDAVADMRDAFTNRDVQLVVWNNAADVVDPQINADVDYLRGLRRNAQIKSYIAGESCWGLSRLFLWPSRGVRLDQHFGRIADKMKVDPVRLLRFRAESEKLTTALRDGLQTKEIVTEFRSRKAPPNSAVHFDRVLEKNDILVLRVQPGSEEALKAAGIPDVKKTLYFDANDITVRYGRDKSGAPKIFADVKPDAEAWQAEDGAVVFHSQHIAHQEQVAQPGAPVCQRVLEMMQVTSRQSFVACHRYSL